MDEQTKATARALLDLHPRGYAGELGIQVTKSPKGLFRLLCFAILAEDASPSPATGEAMRALQERGLDSAPEMAQSSEEERTELLREAGHGRADEAADWLHQAAEQVLDRHDGDLNNLLDEAEGDHHRIRAALGELPGMDEAGIAVFLREVQMMRPEVAPFADEGALAAAKRLGLPIDAEELMTDVARGQRNEELANLVGALALVEARDEYDEVRKHASS